MVASSRRTRRQKPVPPPEFDVVLRAPPRGMIQTLVWGQPGDLDISRLVSRPRPGGGLVTHGSGLMTSPSEWAESLWAAASLHVAQVRRLGGVLWPNAKILTAVDLDGERFVLKLSSTTVRASIRRGQRDIRSRVWATAGTTFSHALFASRLEQLVIGNGHWPEPWGSNGAQTATRQSPRGGPATTVRVTYATDGAGPLASVELDPRRCESEMLLRAFPRDVGANQVVVRAHGPCWSADVTLSRLEDPDCETRVVLTSHDRDAGVTMRIATRKGEPRDVLGDAVEQLVRTMLVLTRAGSR